MLERGGGVESRIDLEPRAFDAAGFDLRLFVFDFLRVGEGGRRSKGSWKHIVSREAHN